MIRYKIYQNQQKKGLNAGKWFARAVSDEMFDLAKLAEHMSKHVLYCTRGLFSQEGAEMLREKGIPALSLKGGSPR